MNLQHKKIIAAARDRGIEVTPLEKYGEKEAHLLCYNGREELVVAGNFLSQLTLQNHRLCNNKQLTKEIFARLKIPFPQSVVFKNFKKERAAIVKFWHDDMICVCKPLCGTKGEGVQMNISSLQKLQKYWQQWCSKFEYFLLEEQVAGDDLRIQVIAGKVVAACIREPAFVVGDSINSVAALIEKRRQIIKKQNPANRLDIDEPVLDLLQRQNLALQSVPCSGQKVRLKYIANMSQGARAIDVTDKIDNRFHEWVQRFAGGTGMSLFAFDFIAGDCAHADPGTVRALEINPQPEWLHHTFSQDRTHDIAGMILRWLFGDVL